jgi:hypothetical protein
MSPSSQPENAVTASSKKEKNVTVADPQAVQETAVATQQHVNSQPTLSAMIRTMLVARVVALLPTPKSVDLRSTRLVIRRKRVRVILLLVLSILRPLMGRIVGMDCSALVVRVLPGIYSALKL